MQNVTELHNEMIALLKENSVERPRVCAEIIISKVLDIQRVEIYAYYDREVETRKADEIKEQCRRLAEGEPITRIVGDSHFFSYSFKVTPGVFIPRPETEILVEIAASLLKKETREHNYRILDACAGSGVIGVTMLKLFESANAVTIDINPESVAVIRENAVLLGVADRIDAIEGDLFAPLAGNESFDVLLSNPPYIPTSDILTLPRIVREHDPIEALDGGADGLDLIRAIIEGAPAIMADGALIALEVGVNQARDVKKLLDAGNFRDCRIYEDLSGIERVVTGWRK